MTRRLLLALALVAGLLAPAATAAGRPGGPEVVGGQPAAPDEYPFMVGLLHRNVINPFQAQFCGGSLISPDTVLTAAHCVEGVGATELDVLVGTNRLDGSGTRLHARRIVTHPGYNRRTNGNDLAIVQLGTQLPQALVATVQPGEEALWWPGTLATVIGWGTRSATRQSFPVQLYEVDLPIVSDASCSNAYDDLFLASKMLCAGDLANGGEDSCQGDSGGPLLVPDPPRMVQVGIVSWGIGCARRRYPGVYTRLATYASFVNRWLDPDEVPDPPSRLRHRSDVGGHPAIAWDAPLFDGGTRITDYVVSFPNLGQSFTVAGNHRWAALPLPSGRHLVRVQAENAIGLGAPKQLFVNA